MPWFLWSHYGSHGSSVSGPVSEEGVTGKAEQMANDPSFKASLLYFDGKSIFRAIREAPVMWNRCLSIEGKVLECQLLHWQSEVILSPFIYLTFSLIYLQTASSHTGGNMQKFYMNGIFVDFACKSCALPLNRSTIEHSLSKQPEPHRG